MKASRFFWPVLAVLFVAALALSPRTLADDDGDLATTFAGVEEFPVVGGDVVDGTSILTRNEDGVAYTFSTRSLGMARTYTNWWVTFNNPEDCTTSCACSDVDFANPAVDIGVFWATGRFSNGLGQADFSAEVEYGELPGGADQVPFSPDFASPIKPGAEIHLVVRAHGPTVGDGEAQLTQFNGGCPPHPIVDPEVNPNADGCVDVQFSVHRAPQCEAGDDDDD